MTANDDVAYMKLAVEEAAKSKSEDERIHPRVGVVVVKDGQILARAHRGESTLGEHAEFTALERKLSSDMLSGATVYTTLEPCTSRNHPKVPCAVRLVERRVRRVVVGMLDPNENICGRGLWHLRESMIETDLFPHDLMSQVEDLNREFIRVHRRRRDLPEPQDQKSAATPTKPAEQPVDPQFELFVTLFDSMAKGKFDAAEEAFTKLQEKQTDAGEKTRFRLLYLQLRSIHARDSEALSELERASQDTPFAEYATTLLAERSETVGNMDEAALMFRRAAEVSANNDARCQLLLRSAVVLGQANRPDAAASTLLAALGLSTSPRVRAQTFAALADLDKGPHAAIVKAALLVRAATLEPSDRSLFYSAYALADAGFYGTSVVQYESQLRIAPNDAATLNNIAVAYDRLGLRGTAVSRYKMASDKGNSLAMANLAQSYLQAGFVDEAARLLKQARMSEDPHQNVGAAMVALAQTTEREKEQSEELKKNAQGHLRFLNALAEAIATSPKPDTLVGPWSVGRATASLTIQDRFAEATWETDGTKHRLYAEVNGNALIGSLQEWSILWNRFEGKATICLVPREDGVLWGLMIAQSGGSSAVEWKRGM